jgi:hypothetical protein
MSVYDQTDMASPLATIRDDRLECMLFLQTISNEQISVIWTGSNPARILGRSANHRPV